MTAIPTPSPAGAPDLPPVPKHIINTITQYGDARADDGLASGPAIGKVITAIREHYGPAILAAFAPQSVSVPESARHMLEETANKLVTYTTIYTGDKQAKRLNNELRELAATLAAAPLPPTQADADLSDKQIIDIARENTPTGDFDPIFSIPYSSITNVVRAILAASPAALPQQGEGSIDSERAAFEAAGRRERYNLTRCADNTDDYAFPAASGAWWAWQARALLARTAAPSEQKPIAWFLWQIDASGNHMAKPRVAFTEDQKEAMQDEYTSEIQPVYDRAAPAPSEGQAIPADYDHNEGDGLAGRVQVRQSIPTDLSKRLRAAIAVNGVIDRVTTLAAADEIDRYYGGMLAWKEAAEEKDSYISELKAAYE